MQTTETSCCLSSIVDGEEIFSPVNKVNSTSGKWMLFETTEDTEDGTFPEVAEYVSLVKEMDDEGTNAFLNWHGGQELEFDNGYCKVSRKSKHNTTATLVFSKPIEIVVAELNGEPVTIKANKITGEFTHEWYWFKNNGRQDKVANGFNVWFDCQKFELV